MIAENGVSLRVLPHVRIGRMGFVVRHRTANNGRAEVRHPVRVVLPGRQVLSYETLEAMAAARGWDKPVKVNWE